GPARVRRVPGGLGPTQAVRRSLLSGPVVRIDRAARPGTARFAGRRRARGGLRSRARARGRSPRRPRRARTARQPPPRGPGDSRPAASAGSRRGRSPPAGASRGIPPARGVLRARARMAPDADPSPRRSRRRRGGAGDRRGGRRDALGATLKRFGHRMKPGDIYCLNDPFEGGMHLPDVFILKPIFYRDERIAFAGTVCHQTDMGGRVAGSNASDSTETYQEGLRIPPVKMYDGGEPNETLFRLIEKNVRVPVRGFGELRAQLAACRI